MSAPHSSRRRLTAFAGALALGFAASADAASISGLSIAINGADPDFRDNGGAEAGEIITNVGVVNSTGSAFLTRYSAGVFSDAGGNGAIDNAVTLNANYSITFNVTNAVNQIWQLTVDTSRVGARTAVDDGAGNSAFDLTAVVGSLSGTGTITAGSLALAAIANSSQGTSVDLAFNQTGNALIQGIGNGTVTLAFTFSATATSDVVGTAGDQAAIRMGEEETLSQFSAGQYPGAGARVQANDGHFVGATLTVIGTVPEPDTALLFAFGLAVVALRRRSVVRRSA